MLLTLRSVSKCLINNNNNKRQTEILYATETENIYKYINIDRDKQKYTRDRKTNLFNSIIRKKMLIGT